MKTLKTTTLLTLLVTLLVGCNNKPQEVETEILREEVEDLKQQIQSLKEEPQTSEPKPFFYDEIKQSNHNTEDFEYSTYWRKKAYEVTIKLVDKRLRNNKPKCKVVRRGFYNPNSIQYVGGQTFIVTYYCEYDCGHNYDNPAYFTVQTTYLGNNEWDAAITDHRLTH